MRRDEMKRLARKLEVVTRVAAPLQKKNTETKRNVAPSEETK